MSDAPLDVTILVGAHTREAAALRSYVVANRATLRARGICASLNRNASRLFAGRLVAPTAEAGRALIAQAGGDGAKGVFLTYPNAFGPQSAALRDEVLYPEAEARAAALAALFPEDRLRLLWAIAPLDQLFARAKRGLAQAARQAPWEMLYELSWADRVEILLDMLPELEIAVLTPEALARRDARVLAAVFGDEASPPGALARHALDAEGQAAMDRVLLPDVAALLARHPADPPRDVYRLGIDRSMVTLFRQRFQEDVARLGAMERVTVL